MKDIKRHFDRMDEIERQREDNMLLVFAVVMALWIVAYLIIM